MGPASAPAGDPPQPVKPAAAPSDVDLDLVFEQLRPLAQDPAFTSAGVPEGERLLRMMLSEVPEDRRAEVASGLLDARMMDRIADELFASIRIQVARFRDVETGSAFVAAVKAASETEDARKSDKPGDPRVSEATYESGAGPAGRMHGYVARKKYTRNGYAHASLVVVAQIGRLVLQVDLHDLPDITRADVDHALVRAEVAVKDPEAARRAPSPGPVFLASLGPTTTIRAVGADGVAIPRFSFRASWEEAPGVHRSVGGHAPTGTGVTRVRGSATLDVWAARTREDVSLPWGPSTLEIQSGAKDVSVRLPAGLRLAGAVRDRQGNSVEGVRVAAFPTDNVRGIPAVNLPPSLRPSPRLAEAHSQRRTGPAGDFLMEGLGATRYLVTIPSGEDWFAVNDVEVDAGAEPIALVVERALDVDVVVLDPKGSPVAGALVSAFPTRDGAASAGFIRDLMFETDDSGAAHMKRLQPSGTYRLSVYPPSRRKDLTESIRERWVPAPTKVQLPGRVESR